MTRSSNRSRRIVLLALTITSGLSTSADFANLGLVGVGRVDGNSLDSTGSDTLGGIFSSLWIDSTSITTQADPLGNLTYSGTLLGLPDRGFGDGLQDYHPRIQTFDFSFTPVPENYAGPALPQAQIQLRNTGSTILTYDTGSGLSTFTGFNPNDSSSSFPRSTESSLGSGKRSLDPEGLVRTKNGHYFVSDEYGPNVYEFDAQGTLVRTLDLPDALVPKVGGTTTYDQDQNGALTSGRRSNRGLEGLSVSPDQSRLFAMLQSPTVQDGGQDNRSRNTRILAYDLTQPGTPLVAEYVYQLTLQGSPSANRNTPISEILALNNDELLILERDGRGGLTQNNVPTYKSVVRADLRGAQNILGSTYDQVNDTTGQTDFPLGMAISVTPVQREDLVNLLDANQLAKFGLNVNGTADENSISEKWEGLGLIPNLSTRATDDFYLLVGNDNDFLASEIIHNGQIVGTSPFTQDNLMLAYSVRLPGATTNVPDSLPNWCALAAFAGCALAGRRVSGSRPR